MRHRHGSAKQITDKARMNIARAAARADNEGSVRVRTLFLSDVHLGTRGCQAERPLDFLRHYDADTIFLVGDIVDGWALQVDLVLAASHNDVVQKILRKARKGTRMIYIPGNHDEFLRDYYGSHFGGIEVVESAVHVTAAGQHLLVIHGDLFDVVIKHARWLALAGDKAYDFAIWLNTHFNAIRRAFGFTYWSLSRWAKLKVKNAVNFIGSFEQTLMNEARRHGADGVICGHIHHPVIRAEDSLAYINCGDWVESCTAVVEQFDGRFTSWNGTRFTLLAGWVIVPLILVAECFSWHAVLTRNYPRQRRREFDLGSCLLHRGGRPLPATARVRRRRSGGPRHRDRRHRGLSRVSGDRRRPDVSGAMAVRSGERQQAPERAGRPSRCERSLGRHARHRRVEGRDCLDVAVFQCSGLVEPCAVRLVLRSGCALRLLSSDGPQTFRARVSGISG